MVSLLTKCLHQVVEELLAAGAKLDPLVFDSYLLPLHMAINKVVVVKTHPGFLLERKHTWTKHDSPRDTLRLPNC